MSQSFAQAGLIQLAPAKLNLTLEVLGKRSDGFHEVRSVIQAIELWDSLCLELKPRGIDFQCSQPNLENPENLVLRAAESIRPAVEIKGVSIRLQKGIPEASGLGGGSSDAAATLKGLDWLWGNDLGLERLSHLASQLSSDAPFFLIGGTALAEGRGEKVTPLPSLPPQWAVILKPNLTTPHPKTARLYSALRPEHYSSGEHTSQLVAALTKAGAQTNISETFFNVFEAVAFKVYPGLLQYWEGFKQAGAPSVHLAGSGPALFTLMGEREAALKIYNKLEKERLEVYLARTQNIKH